MNSKARRVENRHQRHHEKQELQKYYEAIVEGKSEDCETTTFNPIRHKLAHGHSEETEGGR